MKRLYFGTDGVRGAYGGPVINPSFAARLGEAAGRWSGGRGRVLIGRDTRASGPALVAAVAQGLAAAGLEPVVLGVTPTPAVARAVRTTDARLGVVITASHNPASDNGIKLFGAGGMKLTDEDEVAIEALLPPATEALPPETWARGESSTDYVAALSQMLPARSLEGWRIVVDTAHGATCGTSPVVLRGLGAEVIGVGNQPDGHNINAGVGSEHPAQLAALVRANRACLGVAHDGDGDRCVLCDETGDVLDGDEILTILALDALRHQRLVANELVVTVQSNLGVDAAIAAAGGRTVRTAVGDRYVLERMLADGAMLGGESSGHIICADVSPTGDGLVAALRVLAVMRETGQPLSQLRRALVKFPQVTRALTVERKRDLAACSALQTEMAAVENELGTQGRVLVRFSGTEPKLRLLVEGPDLERVQLALARLEAAARRDLPVLSPPLPPPLTVAARAG
jgi:phosphoglucosamine mutase